MIIVSVLAVTAAVGAFGMLAVTLGPEDRPGFDERRPLA
jgi:hypothetical protein